MKIALISDLHANMVALDAVLADIGTEGVDQIVCLGDIASLGPHPREVTARIRQLGCPTIQGNHDPLEPGGPALRALEEWTAAQLGDDDRTWLANLPASLDLPLGDLRLLCVHGSPRSYDEQISSSTPAEDLEAMCDGLDFDVMVAGHTHVQVLRRLEGRSVVGVGSVGMPFLEVFKEGTGGAPRIIKAAEYAIVENRKGELHIDLRHLNYNFECYRAQVLASSMPNRATWCDPWD